MGPTVNGLDKLLRMPTGCGEQTMLGLAPDVFVTNYLAATNQLTTEIESKALTYMEKGKIIWWAHGLIMSHFNEVGVYRFANVGRSVGRSVSRSVGRSVRLSVRPSVRRSVRASVGRP